MIVFKQAMKNCSEYKEPNWSSADDSENDSKQNNLFYIAFTVKLYLNCWGEADVDFQ